MKIISASVFESIVDSVARDMPKVAKVSVEGFKVVVTFVSTSGKTNWDSVFEFDKMTGKYRYAAPYLGAALPWVFGDKIARMIRELQK